MTITYNIMLILILNAKNKKKYKIIFIIYFSGNSLLLKSLFSTIFNFSYFLTFVFSFLLNSTTTSFVFFKSFFFSHKLYSTVNSFYHTKYFTTPLTFLLFKTFSTFYYLTPFTSTSFAFSIFCLFTCSLYYIIQLMFTTR